MHPACVIKAISNCALMLHPSYYTSRLCLVILFYVSVYSQCSHTESGYHKVKLSPVCRVRKENFDTCDYDVKLFQLNLSFWTIFGALYCRMSCRGNLKHIRMCRNRSLCILDFGNSSSGVRKNVTCNPRAGNKQTGWQLLLMQ